MSISFSGLASGIDYDSIITSLLEVERRPILDLQRQIAFAEQKRAAYQDLNGRITSLNNALKALDGEDLFGTLSVNSSDEGLLTATATSDAPIGTHRIEIQQLATSHRIAGQGFIDNNATAVAAADGKFSFRIGSGVVVELDVDNGTTLQALAEAINASDEEIRADIINDGTGSNPYRLVLTATSEGEGGRIEVTQNDTTIDFANKQIESLFADEANAADYTGLATSSGIYTGDANTTFMVEVITAGQADGSAKFKYSTDGGLTFNDNGGAGFDVTSAGPIALADGVEINFTDDGSALQAGDLFNIDVFNPSLDEPQDAILEVNGITIRKSTNTIDDVFNGLTLNLKGSDPGQVITLGIEQNVGDVQSALTGFIGSYNAIIGYLNSQFSYDPSEGGASPALSGDSAARQVQKSLVNFVTGRFGGLSGDSLSSLAELGFASNESTGLLALDASVLSAQLEEDPAAVERLLTRFGEKLSGNFTYLRRSSDSEPGTYDVEITQARTRGTVIAGAAAEVLAANETITVDYDVDAAGDHNVTSVQVNLLAGDTAAQQVNRFNAAFEAGNIHSTAYLDAGGKLSFRATEYGQDFSLIITSDTAAGVGTSQIGNAPIAGQGTDLEGTIGGRPARVLDGDHLKGSSGFDTEDIEVIIPGDVSGRLGQVRIVDGLSESLPELLSTLNGSDGVLSVRTEGLAKSITSYEEQIVRTTMRVEKVESRLRRQFTSLEVQLGGLQALGDYVTQAMANLPTYNRK